MARSLSRVQLALLGFAVLLALSLAGWGLFLVQDRAGWSSQSFHVHAAFADINGVEAGSRVRIQGMDAGEVEAIVAPERPGDAVRLRLRLARKYHHLVGSDARVQIVNENLLAGKIVRIVPGSPGATAVPEEGDLTALVQPDAMEGIAQAATRLNSLLGEVDHAVQDLRKREGSAGSLTRDLAASAARLHSVLAKTETTLTRLEKGEGTLGKLLQDDSLYRELTGTLARVQQAMDDIESGDGTLGRLVKSNEAYAEALTSLHDVRRMVASVKQNSDAIKSLPVVRSYVVDPHKELTRPDCQRLRRWYREKDIFEPGRAVLTDEGRRRLDEAATWLHEYHDGGTEVVVASFAAPGLNPDYAQTLTQKQSEVAAEYLKGTHRVHRTGWWWWSTRGVRPVGCGVNPSPVPETETLPPSRLEVILFVRQ
jgi:phospholipid/cholesterol/gamma-HCH transport system substrate-binding protein